MRMFEILLKKSVFSKLNWTHKCFRSLPEHGMLFPLVEMEKLGYVCGLSRFLVS